MEDRFTPGPHFALNLCQYTKDITKSGVDISSIMIEGLHLNGTLIKLN